MRASASDLARALSREAERVCRHFLRRGRREGRYWIVGDVHGSPGRSLYVRLSGPDHGGGAAGKWTDAATGEHGDLLDLIALQAGHHRLSDTLDAARLFLALPREPPGGGGGARHRRAAAGSRAAAQRLFAAGRPIPATLAATYLAARSLFPAAPVPALRFHPRCWYRPNRDDGPDVPSALPALLAAVTDDAGTLTGVHRTWLDPATATRAAVATPRRAMGDLLGHGVRFGEAAAIMAAGEGIETMLSLRTIAPGLPMIAALSAAHLAAIAFPAPLRRLYVAREPDAASEAAWRILAGRAEAAGIALVALHPPVGSDFNDALSALGREQLGDALAAQWHGDDVGRFLMLAA